MRRVRWLGAGWQQSIRTLASRLKSAVFTPDVTDGFMIERVRESSIEGRFIEKLLLQESFTDPFGKEQIYERLAYRQTSFLISSQFPNIELVDPPRSTTPLITRLSTLTDFTFTVHPLTVDVMVWAGLVEKELGRKVVIDSLQVSNLEIEKKTFARIGLRGDGDVRESMNQIVRHRRYSVDRIQFRYFDTDALCSAQLLSGGIAAFNDRDREELLPVFRNTVRLAAEKAEVSVSHS